MHIRVSLTGPEFRRWAETTQIAPKEMADHLGISVTTLYNLFNRAKIKPMQALAIKNYQEQVEAKKGEVK